jgi:uncharacterized membrane protein
MGKDRSAEQQRRLKNWVQLLGVLFRILILSGLVILIFAVILVLFTNLVRWWMLGFPLAIIVMGVLLARIEYLLYKRL